MTLYRKVPDVEHQINELSPELLSINSLNPWSGQVSSSRGTMFSSSHIAQTLVVDGAGPRYCQTGTESEFGKYTFKHKIPCDAEVIRVVHKFRPTVGQDSIRQNPTTLVIYENMETKEVDILELNSYSTAIDNKHQHFGFRYNLSPLVGELHPNMRLKAGTVLGDSPAIPDPNDPNSTYNYGVETNVAFMGIPGIIEDGIVVSEDYLDRITSRGYEKRTVSFGKKQYPLNLYGDSENYKPFPDIGDTIREDGLLFALRSYDDLLAPIEMDPRALREPDYVFDKLVYGVPGGKVIDVNVRHDDTNRVPPTPFGMERQPEKYHNALVRYYRTILETYNDLHKDRKKFLNISPEFHRLVVEAMSYVGFEDNPTTQHLHRKNPLSKRRVKKLYRRHDIDDWRVEIAFEYKMRPNISGKLTATFGDKGVICSIWPAESMPVDADGNRAEVIMDGDSTIKRMNIGRCYEQYINAASRDVAKRVREGLDNGTSDVSDAYNYLLSYYKTVSPRMYETMVAPDYTGTPEEHVKKVYDEGIYLWIPTDNPINMVDCIRKIQEYFPPTFTPVTYDGGVVTDRPILIGSMYILMLEKTGVDWSGTSSAKLQHFGIPARVSNADKHATPGRNQPVRILGEAEVRLLNAVVGSDVTADLLDQSNNPATHKAIVREILQSHTPTDIEKMIDRRDVPLGNSRSIQFVNHILECAGVEFVREVDDPIRQSDMENRLKELQAQPKKKS